MFWAADMLSVLTASVSAFCANPDNQPKNIMIIPFFIYGQVLFKEVDTLS